MGKKFDRFVWSGYGVLFLVLLVLLARDGLFTELSHWFSRNKETDINFYLGSGTYHNSWEGGAYGYLYFGPYKPYAHLTNYPTKKGDYAYYGPPEGKLVAFWLTYTETENIEDTELHYYYAATPKGETNILPERPKNHWEYEIYAFFGHLYLFEDGLDVENFQGDGIHYTEPGRPDRFRIGEVDSFYYFVQSRLPSDTPSWTQNQEWHEVKGIEITKEQFESLECSSEINNDDCTPFLTENTPGLTPEQLAYVKAHPITKADFAALIQWLDNLPDNPWK